jgi:glycosyltransferase involved in cell wall biosynthesis
MRIALVGPVYPYRGGIAHFNNHLVSHLQMSKHDVKVFSFRRQYPGWLYPGKSDREADPNPITIDAEFLLDPFQPWTWSKCAQQIQMWQPDLVLITWWTIFWWLSFTILATLLERKNIKTAFLIHNIKQHESRWWDRILTKIALNSSDRFLVQSESQYASLKVLVPDAIIEQCVHPIYNQFSGNGISQNQARKVLNLKEDVYTVLFFGIIRPYKGLRKLIAAIAKLKETGMDVQLAIAGEFWEPLVSYQNQIDQLKLNDAVRIFPGYIPNEKIALYFAASDLLAAPYVSGTQSGVAKLALGFGLPVLITECIADDLLRSLINRGVTIAQSANSDELSAAIFQARSMDTDLSSALAVGEKSWSDFINSIKKLI